MTAPVIDFRFRLKRVAKHVADLRQLEATLKYTTTHWFTDGGAWFRTWCGRSVVNCFS